MDTKCVLLLANVFRYSYEADFMHLKTYEKNQFDPSISHSAIDMMSFELRVILLIAYNQLCLK